MSINKLTFLLLLLSIPFLELKSQDFSSKEKAIIYTKAVNVLHDYQDLINQVGRFSVSDIDKAKSSAEKFLELFVTRQALIYNDLDPLHRLSEFYEADTYSSNLILWYPGGMAINLDIRNSKVGDIIKHDNDIYSLDVLSGKIIEGSYQNNELVRDTVSLTFRIAFSTENNSFTNFRIAGIRNISSKYFVDYTQILNQVNIEKFTTDDFGKIQEGVKSLLHDYINYLALIGYVQESTEDKESYKKSFLNLFENEENLLFNDIVPEPQNKLLSATEYLKKYVSDYPDGIKNISLNIDSAKFGNVVKSKDGQLYTYVTTDKSFSGDYNGNEIFRNASPLIFKVSFDPSGKTFSNFKITSIDLSTQNFYTTSSENTEHKNPESKIRPVTRKGITVSVQGAFVQTSINNQNINDSRFKENFGYWNITPQYNYSAGAGVSCFFNDHISIRSGFEINRYTQDFKLKGTFQDPYTSKDINGMDYYRIIDADFDSLVTINYLTIPLIMGYTGGKPGETGFFLELGAKLSFPKKVNYRDNGNYKFTGYYPENPDGLKYLDFEELGFYNHENVDTTGKITTKSFITEIYVSAGLNIPLSYYTSLSVGPEITLGLSELFSKSASYLDIFANKYDQPSAKIMSFGIRISLNFKL
jgi:hypothetical protein